MAEYTVSAVPWEHGWELHVDNEGVTQVRTLNRATDQVRDYLATIHGADYSEAAIIVEPGISQRELVKTARAHAQAAAEMQTQASQEMRDAARQLRDSGYSVSDMATLLGVSRGAYPSCCNNRAVDDIVTVFRG